MILGYTVDRPKEENYKDFEEKLVSGLRDLDIGGLSLMLYGSYVRGDYNPGRSDIDAVMIFPDDVVINKENLELCSKVLAFAQEGNHIPFQVTVCDESTLRDGRFNSYTADFEAYFREEGKVILGNDPREYMIELEQKTGDMHAVSFNLRKSRTGLLFFDYHLECDYEKLLNNFRKTLDAASRASKQILYFIDGRLRKQRFSGLKRLRDDFPEVDIAPLISIKRMYENPGRLDRVYEKPNFVLHIWENTLTMFEEIIRAYIKKYPRESQTNH